MKILVLNHEFPPVGGGGGRATEDICSRLQNNGHEVFILTSKLIDLPFKESARAGEIFRIPTARKFAYKARFVDMALYVLFGFWFGIYLIISRKPDVIHVHFAVPGGALAWMLSKISRIPYVLTTHLGDIPGGNPEKTKKWFRWILPFTAPIWDGASHVATVSEYTRKLAESRYSCSIEVIPNGVDLQTLDPGVIHANHPPRILFAGRFAPQKNLSFFVDILASLKEGAWECTMIGDGALFNSIKEKINQFGLASKISLTGWVTPENVIAHLKTGDILLMPSLSEGLPVVGVQAAALGLAIIASPVGGFIDLVENGKNGFLIEGYDIQDWKKELRDLIVNNEKLTAFRQSSRTLAEKFSIEQVSSRYEEIFHSLSISNSHE